MWSGSSSCLAALWRLSSTSRPSYGFRHHNRLCHTHINTGDDVDDVVVNLQQLVSRNRRRRRDPLVGIPLHFSADAVHVANGTKPLLHKDSRIGFACTACGKCCRSFAETVVLDFDDIARMSAKYPSAGGSNASIVATKPNNFNSVFGQFEEGILSPEDRSHLRRLRGALLQEADRDRISVLVSRYSSHARHLAPIVMLKRSQSHPSAELNADSIDSSEAPCSFAIPFDNPRMATTHPNKSIRPPARFDSANLQSAADHHRQTLRCSLGPKHMPATCRLYPFGELARVPDKSSTTNSGEVALMRTLLTVDVAQCEGVKAIEYPSHHQVQSSTTTASALPPYAFTLKQRQDKVSAIRDEGLDVSPWNPRAVTEHVDLNSQSLIFHRSLCIAFAEIRLFSLLEAMQSRVVSVTKLHPAAMLAALQLTNEPGPAAVGADAAAPNLKSMQSWLTSRVSHVWYEQLHKREADIILQTAIVLRRTVAFVLETDDLLAAVTASIAANHGNDKQFAGRQLEGVRHQHTSGGLAEYSATVDAVMCALYSKWNIIWGCCDTTASHGGSLATSA
jgi:hypothetical protein